VEGGSDAGLLVVGQLGSPIDHGLDGAGQVRPPGLLPELLGRLGLGASMAAEATGLGLLGA
jgi:hypothetical protein